ncbi:MAG: TonB-dependent receptor [Bdellovibrionales bacterium]|nr:TonB-dependent receptor [Bdellovibrionales bacterium]
MTSWLLVLGLLAGAAQAQDERATELAPVQVFGEGGELLNRPLAPKVVDRKKVEAFQYTDVNRALKQTTGVYSREEDGQGLRPNIGLRGTNPDRSKKVTVMEDGVLIGPAPFSAPAAYYTPGMNTVESLEIYKGFTGHPYGPNSVGGAVNYITPPVPFEAQTKLSASYGSFNTLNLKGLTGAPTSFGGYLLQATRLQTDGFKKLDGGGKTGFVHNGILGKLRFDLPGNGHNLQFTGGYDDEDSHETYLGLSRGDFDASPYRRYSSSAEDEMKWKHHKVQLRHQLQLGDGGTLETTLYHHTFRRTWYRLDRFRNTAISLRDVMMDPTSAGYAPYFDIVRGTTDSSTLGINGELVTAGNQRVFLSEGLQTRVSQEFSLAGKHALEGFARLHHDRIQRNHISDRYQMTNGRLQRTTDPTQTDAVNRDETKALTLMVLDNWDAGPVTLTPVVRWESAQFEYSDSLLQSGRTRHDEVWLPGLGISTKLSSTLSSRVSVNRAATLAGLSSDGSEQREEALNYELEFKHADPYAGREGSLIFYYNDYRNITGTCTASGGCTVTQLDQVFNGGKARVIGMEAQAAQSFRFGATRWPIQINASLLQGTFQSHFNSKMPDWGIGDVEPGDPLPYIPQVQYSVSLGTEYRNWRSDLTISYQGKMYDQAVAPRAEIPGHGLVDWAGSYSFSKHHRLHVKADNLLARNYIAGARPYGYRPGKPQSFQAGWIWQF